MNTEESEAISSIAADSRVVLFICYSTKALQDKCGGLTDE